jgi:hypothetical protein
VFCSTFCLLLLLYCSDWWNRIIYYWSSLVLYSFSLMLLLRLLKIFERFVQVSLHISGIKFLSLRYIFCFFNISLHLQEKRGLVRKREDHCTTRDLFSTALSKVSLHRYVIYLLLLLFLFWYLFSRLIVILLLC